MSHTPLQYDTTADEFSIDLTSSFPSQNWMKSSHSNNSDCLEKTAILLTAVKKFPRKVFLSESEK